MTYVKGSIDFMPVSSSTIPVAVAVQGLLCWWVVVCYFIIITAVGDDTD
jgi:hypothetical protein